jgi:hypothetical protein
MAGYGGRREGAGRKPLSETVKKVDAKIINAGILPLEMRLRVARHMWAEAVEVDQETGETKITDLAKAKEAADFAEPALPYTSNRLATMIHTGPSGGAIEHKHEVVDDVRGLIREELGESPAISKH